MKIIILQNLIPGWGFFFGTIPGMVFIFINMWIFSRLAKQVRVLALAEGQDWGVKKDLSQLIRALEDPNEILCPGESKKLAEIKKTLINKQWRFMVKHLFGGLLIALGGTVGTVLGVYVQDQFNANSERKSSSALPSHLRGRGQVLRYPHVFTTSASSVRVLRRAVCASVSACCDDAD